jgi:hypothetical protein
MAAQDFLEDPLLPVVVDLNMTHRLNLTAEDLFDKAFAQELQIQSFRAETPGASCDHNPLDFGI